MIELYKVNGKLKARTKLLADYREAVIASAKSVWTKEKRAEYDALYPAYRTEMVEDVETQVKCMYTHTFDSWLAEEYVVEVAVEEVKYENGFVTTPAKPAVMKLVREFVAPEVSEEQFEAYLKTRYAEMRKAEYPDAAEYLDAVVKGDVAAQEAYTAKCLAVKAKYPKPDVDA